MKIYLSIFFLLINCAVSTAQSYHFKGFDLDTGANLTRWASFNKFNKEIVITSTSLLWHKQDSFNRYYTKANFNIIDSASNIAKYKSIEKLIERFGIRGNLKLIQGGYLGFGYYQNYKTQNEGKTGIPGCIVKYNENGDTIFSSIFPFSKDNSEIRSIRQLKDSSIVLVAFLLNNSNAFTALRLIKLNLNFDIVWDSVYYYSLLSNQSEPRVTNYIDAIEETEDGGLLIGSSIWTRTADREYDALLFKIDKNGKFLWERRFNFNQDGRTEINKIIKLQDGNYLLVGYYHDNNWLNPDVDDYIFLIKVNPNGDLISKKLVHGYMYQYIFDALEKPNGDLLLAGTFAKGINGFDDKAGLMCLNSKGEIKWHRQYERPSNMNIDEFLFSYLSDMEIANDGTIMAVGNIAVMDSTFKYNGGLNQDIIFLYTDSNGCVDPSNCTFTTVEEQYVMPYYFQAYPNPSSGLINFSTNVSLSSSARINIYNTLGQLLLQKEITDFSEALDLTLLAKGMYVLEIQSEELRSTQKLIIE